MPTGSLGNAEHLKCWYLLQLCVAGREVMAKNYYQSVMLQSGRLKSHKAGGIVAADQTNGGSEEMWWRDEWHGNWHCADSAVIFNLISHFR